MNSWLRSSLIAIARSNRHTDCTFTIESEGGGLSRVFACHKLIFSCASEVFDRMLYGNYNESSGEVKLSDVEADVFEKFRDYVYGYEYDKLQHYDFDTLIKLAEFGNKYLVESIKEDCVLELQCRKDTYDIGEQLRLFQCAHTLNKPTLIDQIAWDLTSQSKTSLSHAGIYEFNTDVFKHYIKVIENKLSEAERFNLIEMYLRFHGLDNVSLETGNAEAAASNEATDKSGTISGPQLQNSSTNISVESKTEVADVEKNVCAVYITELIALIDFSKFTPKEFYEGPGKSNFLSMAQKYEYLYKIARNYAQSKEELETKLGNSFDSTYCFSEPRRVVTLGGTVVRGEREQSSHKYDRTARMSRYRDNHGREWEDN